MKATDSIVHIYHDAFGDNRRYVASIYYPNAHSDGTILQEAYQQTQTLTGAWINNEGVNISEDVQHKGGCRSTSVGDLMNIVHGDGSNQWYKVDDFGFSKQQ